MLLLLWVMMINNLDPLTAAIVRWWFLDIIARQIVWYAFVMWLLDRWLLPLCIDNLRTAEITVARTLQFQIIQYAFVIDILCIAAMFVLQIRTALIQAVGVLRELSMTRFLNQSEELQRAIGNLFALLYTLSWVAQFFTT